MTARNDDRLLSAWLHDVAPDREPEHLLGEVLARTARTRRRPAWRNPERLHLMSAITSRFAPASPVPWRLIAVAAALLIALVAGLVLLAGAQRSQLAPPFGLAENGPMYYSQDGDLYRRPAPGEAATVLVDGAGDDFAPVISPNGAVVSFLRKVDDETNALWAMNADGTNVHQLGIPAGAYGWFEWAPSGDAAVVLLDTKRHALYIVPADGSPAVEHELGIAMEQAYWLAPDGSRLGLLAVDAKGTRGLYLVNRDGTGLTRLALDAGFDTDPDYVENMNEYFWEVSWASSGDRVLYTEWEPAPAPGAAPSRRIRLAAFDASGKVTADSVLVMNAGSDSEFGAQWLPGADGFVFQSRDGTRWWLSLVRIGPNGPGNAVELPVSSESRIGFQISPDGSQLIAQMYGAGDAFEGIRLVDLEERSSIPLDVGEDASWQRRAISGR